MRLFWNYSIYTSVPGTCSSSWYRYKRRRRRHPSSFLGKLLGHISSRKLEGRNAAGWPNKRKTAKINTRAKIFQKVYSALNAGAKVRTYANHAGTIHPPSQYTYLLPSGSPNPLPRPTPRTVTFKNLFSLYELIISLRIRRGEGGDNCYRWCKKCRGRRRRAAEREPIGEYESQIRDVFFERGKV